LKVIAFRAARSACSLFVAFLRAIRLILRPPGFASFKLSTNGPPCFFSCSHGWAVVTDISWRGLFFSPRSRLFSVVLEAIF